VRPYCKYLSFIKVTFMQGFSFFIKISFSEMSDLAIADITAVYFDKIK
jgi:hypothetical protein